MIERLPSAALYIVRQVDGKTETYESSRFHQFEAPQTAPSTEPASPADG